MRPDALPPLTGPTIVCVQAGNVNTGAFDPCREIIDHVRGADVPVWVHADGAFGLWARVAPARAHLADGIELADSWATDAHKWLNSPYDCGIVIVRDGNALRKTMSINADYLPSDQSNPSDYTPEVSRRPRGVDAWAALRTLGRSGLADLVERNCRLAKRFADAFSCRRVCGAERCRAQSGSRFVRRRGAHTPRDRGGSGRWNVLVRRDGVAGQDRDARERHLLGDDRGGCGRLHRGHITDRPKLASVPLAFGFPTPCRRRIQSSRTPRI